jgi:hypothetical protein
MSDSLHKQFAQAGKYTSDVRGVTYDPVANLWRAGWQDSDGVAKAKPVTKWFSVKKLGFEEAKRQAEAARTNAIARGAVQQVYVKDCAIPTDATQLKSAVRGVSWDSSGKCWTTSWTDIDTGKRTAMKFTVCKHGFEEAKDMAERFRKELEQNGMVTKRRPDGSLPEVTRNVSEVADFQPSEADLRTIPGVTYDAARKSWKARWTAADGSRPNKTWDVAMYGFHGAKKLAEEARAAEVEAGARVNLSTKVDMAHDPAKYQSGRTGVTWNDRSGW